MPDRPPLPPDVAAVLLQAELRGAVLPRLFSMVAALASALRLNPAVPPAFWLCLMYASGDLLLSAWELARREPDFDPYLEKLFGRTARDSATADDAARSWANKMDELRQQAMSVLAVLHPLVLEAAREMASDQTHGGGIA